MADAAAAVKGIAGTAAASTKAALISPMFGVAALCGIIAFEWWKGSRDARQFSTEECCPEEVSK